MSGFVGTEFEQRLRRGDPEAVAAERERAETIQRGVTERHQARLRQGHEAQQQQLAVWARQRDELQTAANAAKADLAHARSQLSNAGGDRSAARQAAMEIPALELLAEQARADLTAHVRLQPAVGSF